MSASCSCGWVLLSCRGTVSVPWDLAWPESRVSRKGGFYVATAAASGASVSVSVCIQCWCWCCCLPSSGGLSSCRAQDVGMLGKTALLFSPLIPALSWCVGQCTDLPPVHTFGLSGGSDENPFKMTPYLGRNSQSFPPPTVEQPIPLQLQLWLE